MADRTPEFDRLWGDFGINPSQLDEFLRGDVVVYPLPTWSHPGVGMSQLTADRCLRSGIVEVSDPGRGLATLSRFRTRTMDLARAMGLPEIELFGAAIITPKLEDMLKRQGFLPRSEAIPEDLGDDGSMEIYFKRFPVDETRA